MGAGLLRYQVPVVRSGARWRSPPGHGGIIAALRQTRDAGVQVTWRINPRDAALSLLVALSVDREDPRLNHVWNHHLANGDLATWFDSRSMPRPAQIATSPPG